jgi:hypothetical protein
MKIMWYALNVVNNYGEKKGQLRVSKASPNKREFGDDDYECFNGIKIGVKRAWAFSAAFRARKAKSSCPSRKMI